MPALAEHRHPGQAGTDRRPGSDPPTVNRLYDRRERALAVRIARECPGWVVLWGVFSRRYWAFPTGAAIPRGTVLSAPDPRGLIATIRQAELAAASGSPLHLPPLARPDQPCEGGPRYA